MTTPIVSTVIGSITTGQVLDITGTHMVDESQSSWVPFHATNPTAGQMQGTDLVGMGFDTPHNADWVADTSVKLFGTKSFRNHTSGQIIHVAPTNFAHAGSFSIFGPTDMGSALATSDVWFRVYARFDVGANGEWPNGFGGGSNDFKVMSKYPGGNGTLGFWSSLDVPDSIGVPPSGIRLTPTGAIANSHSSGPTIIENRWYCIELKAPLNSNNHVWQIYVDNALVFSQDLGQGIDFTADANQFYAFFVNWYSTSPAFDQFIWCNGVAAKNNGRIGPSSIVEIADSSTYASATKRYQAPEFLSDTSSQIRADLTGLSAGPYWLFVTNNLGQTSVGFSLSVGGPDTTPPSLTLPLVSSITSSGGIPSVSTTENNGVLTMTNVPSNNNPSDDQIEVGLYSNGAVAPSQNIVVVSAGVKIFSALTGVPPLTAQDTHFIHRDAATNRSAPTKFSWVTLANTPATLLLYEAFNDASFAARNWFDVVAGVIDTSVISPGGGAGSLKVSWTAPGTGATNTSPVAPRRHLITATDTVYVSYWQKLGTALVPWQGSGVSFHPHTFQILTDADDDWIGPSNTNLSVRLDLNVFTPRFNISDGLRMFLSNPYPSLAGTYPHNNVSPSLLGTGSPHAVMGGNGQQMVSSVYYDAGSAWENTSDWNAAAPAFVNNTWHHVEAYVALNSIVNGIPQANGILKYWVDGVLVINYTNVYLRTTQYATQKFNKILFVPYIGVGSPIAQDMWIDELRVYDAIPTSLFKNYFARDANGTGILS